MRSLLTVLGVFIVFNCLAPNLGKIEKKNQFISTSQSYRRFIRISKIQRAIRFEESANRYSIIGNDGEYGAYQYLKDTWKSINLLLFGKVLDITIPANQDLVTRARIERLIGLGYSDQQIAAIWNCGKSQYQDLIGINSSGHYYNVPRYVDKVIRRINAYGVETNYFD